MSPGASVRISSDCSLDGRTGTVTETPPFWSALGFVSIALDGPGVTAGCVPASELVPHARPAQAGQLGLFGGAA